MTQIFRCRTVAAVLLAWLALLPKATGDPVQWDGNGHWYELVKQSVSWEEARRMAESLTWQRMPGHLVTLTSAKEDEFVYANFTSTHPGVWLGGYQDPPDDPDPAANWHWVTGERWEYTHWAEREPNDGGGGEFYLDSWPHGGPCWNDESDRYWHAPFVVEYESAPLGACCIGGSECVLVTEEECVDHGGDYQGDGSYCEPNPCIASPVDSRSWGALKSLFGAPVD